MDADLDPGERRHLRRKAREATLAALRSLGGEARRDAIRDRAVADGGFTRRETQAPAPQARPGRSGGLVDHELSWALAALKRDGLLENPRRRVWRLAGAATAAAPRSSLLRRLLHG